VRDSNETQGKSQTVRLGMSFLDTDPRWPRALRKPSGTGWIELVLEKSLESRMWLGRALEDHFNLYQDCNLVMPQASSRPQEAPSASPDCLSAPVGDLAYLCHLRPMPPTVLSPLRDLKCHPEGPGPSHSCMWGPRERKAGTRTSPNERRK
jgi:hypothetical protein